MAFLSLFKKNAKSWFIKARKTKERYHAEALREAMSLIHAVQEGGDIGYGSDKREIEDEKKRKKMIATVRYCIDKALEIDPKYAPALLAKGEFLTKYGGFIGPDDYSDKEYIFTDEAIDCFDKCVSASPDVADAYFYKGRILETNKDYDNAFSCFDKGTSVNPRDKLAWLGKLRILIINGTDKDIRDCKAIIDNLGSRDERDKDRWEHIII